MMHLIATATEFHNAKAHLRVSVKMKPFKNSHRMNRYCVLSYCVASNTLQQNEKCIHLSGNCVQQP